MVLVFTSTTPGLRYGLSSLVLGIEKRMFSEMFEMFYVLLTQSLPYLTITENLNFLLTLKPTETLRLMVLLLNMDSE